jgi:hypothetical protein
MTTIKGTLRAAVLAGAVGSLPSLGLANDVPDHAEAEEPAANDTTSSVLRTTPGVPDHAEAEARRMRNSASPEPGPSSIVPDHETAEGH